jgi:PTS system nitrogen regulatory IIA component
VKVADFLAPGCVTEIEETDRRGTLARLAGALADAEPAVRAGPLLEALVGRERVASTGVGDGIALPHASVPGVARVVGALGRSRRGVDFGAADGRPCQLVFLLVAPPSAPGDHLRALSRVARLLRDAAVRRRLVEAPDAASLYARLTEEDGRRR